MGCGTDALNGAFTGEAPKQAKDTHDTSQRKHRKSRGAASNGGGQRDRRPSNSARHERAFAPGSRGIQKPAAGRGGAKDAGRRHGWR